MAKISFLNVNPAAGSGNTTVSVGSESTYYGREPRKATLTFQASNCEEEIPIEVIQKAASAFITPSNRSISLPQSGGFATLKGSSNLEKLKFEQGVGDAVITDFPDTYRANGMAVTIPNPIPNDPGAKGKFDFEFMIKVEGNETPTPKTKKIIVSNETKTVTETYSIEVASRPEYIKILNREGGESITSLEIPASGAANTLFVNTNTNWNIKMV